eukprot:scaffold31989_cov54-Attheya_sp.AAC.5
MPTAAATHASHLQCRALEALFIHHLRGQHRPHPHAHLNVGPPVRRKDGRHVVISVQLALLLFHHGYRRHPSLSSLRGVTIPGGS